MEGRIDGEDVVLKVDGAYGSLHLRVTGISDVRQGQHAWGAGLQCRGFVNGADTEVWLV